VVSAKVLVEGALHRHVGAAVLGQPGGQRQQAASGRADLLIVELTQGRLLTRNTMQYRNTDPEPTRCPNQRRLPLVTFSSNGLILR